jgi:P-type Mg2+ transporter
VLENISKFWSLSKNDLFDRLSSSLNGLTEDEARKRLAEQRKRLRIIKPWHQDLMLLFSQFKSPLVLLLVFAVILSIVLGEYSDSIIILTVLLTTGILGFIQERNASRAVQKLHEMVHSKAMVRRNGVEKDILIDEVIPGDIVVLNAGDVVPADAFILEANDLHINESVLTGESFPVEKFAGESSAEEMISKVVNAVFKGTSVINGTATIIVVNTGSNTELGKITTSLEQSVTITTFEKGIMQFGYLLMRLTILFTGLILILNIFFHRSFIESLLFSLALTVGLTPELLPAILTVTLAAGAKRMASKKVIVKKLSSIQNLGEIDVLCSDKTGTITEGVVKLNNAVDMDGKENKKLLLYAYLNATYETGFTNPIDEAIREIKDINIAAFAKCDEVPYDFIRKRLSIVVTEEGKHKMITKGAVANILEVCNKVEKNEETLVDIKDATEQLQKQFEQLSNQGLRVIAVSYKDVTGDPVINKDDEKDMIFLGFLIFSDPIKKGIVQSIQHLKDKGIALKIITGDNHLVARYLAQQINLPCTDVLTGTDLHNLTSDALKIKIEQVDVFAEILPAQKERIIKALQSVGHSVGYMGDGINDANALKAADVGISISNAVDVAKEAADLVLLDQNIDVIKDGVEEGRRTFMNTLKYIFVTTSANFGNMFSMAIASLILPFFPLLPVQILLNNFLSDLPAITIASDKVDDELVTAPRKWDMAYIWRFMIVFGLLSSIFDFATFGLLLYVFHASPEIFRTAWFMESLLTEILILIIIRTQRPFFKSRPSKYLLSAALATFFACIAIPYLPFAKVFLLYPLPLPILASVLVIVVLYIILSEVSKRYLLKKL